jgi:hypothetical protein
MPPVLIQMLRSRWFAVGVHAGLWLLLYMAITRLGGKAPDLRENQLTSLPARSLLPTERLEPLFSANQWPTLLANTNLLNPFITRYFVPAPTPAPAPPSTMRKVEVTYPGFYQTAESPKHAFLKVAETLVNAPIGAPVVTNLFVAEATMQSLLLTNLAGQTNLLLLNTKKEIEVPLR